MVNTDPVAIVKEMLAIALPAHSLEPEAVSGERTMRFAE